MAKGIQCYTFRQQEITEVSQKQQATEEAVGRLEARQIPTSDLEQKTKRKRVENVEKRRSIRMRQQR